MKKGVITLTQKPKKGTIYLTQKKGTQRVPGKRMGPIVMTAQRKKQSGKKYA